MSKSIFSEHIPTFCALCVSRCGATAVVENGTFSALHPDPSHPTGQALCIKGKVAPDLVHHPRRLLHPLERTRPKGDADPGWRRISWDEALSKIADRLLQIAGEHGPESVVFSAASPSTSAISDSADWIQRLRRSFGSPNLCAAVELCAWGRYFASAYTYGEPVPGAYLPDLERAGCILYWGYNPSVARLSHATATGAALKRGARLIVVDPRRVGLARKADAWLRVRPGTDGALALALSHVMIQNGWFDKEFITRWTNGPFLVRPDNGRLLREVDIDPSGSPERLVAWNQISGQPMICSQRSPPAESATEAAALFGEWTITTSEGPLRCKPVFQHVTDACAAHPLDRVESITGVPAKQVEQAARLLWESRPVAYYAWSGIEQHTNATGIARAIAQLYALTGSFDAPGGNVRFPAVPTNRYDGLELLPPEQRRKALGLARHPLGPSRWEFVTSDDFYTSVLEGYPYRTRALVGFGSNLLLAHADPIRGRQALGALDFSVHADLFMNPTAEMADIVLPVASPFETEALALGFEVNAEAQSLVQLRRPVASRRGEARSDIELVFDLATRLGLEHHFWNGDIDAAFNHVLAPSGLSVDVLRAKPEGVRVPLTTRHRKFAEPLNDGVRGFATPSGRVELYSETLLSSGYPPLPQFEEPLVSPRSRPDLAERYPLVLTCAKSTWFCESQHRGLPSLRRHALEPAVELHPDAARARGILEGDWVELHTPSTSVRARAVFNDSLAPDVVCGQHGWWEPCEELGAPGYDPFTAEGANFNLLIRHQPSDPVSGSVPHRAFVCDVRRAPSAQ